MLPARPLVAQSADWARVAIGLSVGLRSGASLWEVTNQPILSSPPYQPDLYRLRRDVGLGFTLSAQATSYSSRQFGLTFELTYFNLTFNDTCTLARDGGDPQLALACTYVGSSQKFGSGIGDPRLGYHDASGADHSARAMLMQGGIVLRPFRPAALQPTFKALAGFATTPYSTLSMESVYGTDPQEPAIPLVLTVYQDDAMPAFRPLVTVGTGLTTAPNSRLQAHVEVRATFLPQSVVTGPTTSQYQVPPNHSAIKGFVSILFGFDLVLKTARGERY